MAKQTFTTGQVLTAAQMTSLQQTAMGGGSATAKTASYTLVAADAGTTVIMNSASSTTITVNTSLFAAGDTVFIVNQGAGVCTVTAGTATVSTAGSLALSQNETGQLYFLSTSAAIFSDYTQGASTGGMTLLSTTTLSSTSTTISGISGSYKNLQIAIFGVDHASSGANITLQFNGVTSGYFGTTTDDSSTSATRTSNASAIPVLFGNGYGTGGENLTNINIPFYTKTVRKPIEIQSVYKTDDGTRLTGATNGVYGSANTSAVSSITILSSATPTAGTVEIYGIN